MESTEPLRYQKIEHNQDGLLRTDCPVGVAAPVTLRLKHIYLCIVKPIQRLTIQSFFQVVLKTQGTIPNQINLRRILTIGSPLFFNGINNNHT